MDTDDLVVRVLPDNGALNKQFDYVVPARWRNEVEIGTRVRTVLGHRRVGGWVTHYHRPRIHPALT